jgi:hypothetical protein
MPALDQKHAVAIKDHRAHTDDGLRRKLPHLLGPICQCRLQGSDARPALFRFPSNAHHLDDDALFSLTVELGVEDLLPRSEI